MSDINIKNLSHYFKTRETLKVLDNINLTINSGDFIVLLGESGCGKTTLLNLIAGFLKPTEGEILINNEKVDKPHYSRSLIFQQACLLPWLNVKNNILFGCKIRKEESCDISKRADKYIKMLGLEGFENTLPSNLSVGMAQRAAFARALTGMPEVLLLDEPFTALDFVNRKIIQSELIRNWLVEKYTVIFVTHDIEEAILLGKKIVLLGKRPGKIEQSFEIDSKYPRDLISGKFFDLKMEIQKHFENINNIY